MSLQDRIVVDSAVLVGKPTVKGTRLSVEFILDLLANEWSEQQILENYPGLEHADITACLRYAADTLKSEQVFLTPASS